MTNAVNDAFTGVGRVVNKAVDGVGNIITTAIENPLPIIETVAVVWALGPEGLALSSSIGAPATAAVSSAAVAAANGASVENVARAAATAYTGSAVSSGVSSSIAGATPDPTTASLANIAGSAAGGAAATLVGGGTGANAFQNALAGALGSSTSTLLQDAGVGSTLSNVAGGYVGGSTQAGGTTLSGLTSAAAQLARPATPAAPAAPPVPVGSVEVSEVPPSPATPTTPGQPPLSPLTDTTLPFQGVANVTLNYAPGTAPIAPVSTTPELQPSSPGAYLSKDFFNANDYQNINDAAANAQSQGYSGFTFQGQNYDLVSQNDLVNQAIASSTSTSPGAVISKDPLQTLMESATTNAAAQLLFQSIQNTATQTLQESLTRNMPQGYQPDLIETIRNYLAVSPMAQYSGTANLAQDAAFADTLRAQGYTTAQIKDIALSAQDYADSLKTQATTYQKNIENITGKTIGGVQQAVSNLPSSAIPVGKGVFFDSVSGNYLNADGSVNRPDVSTRAAQQAQDLLNRISKNIEETPSVSAPRAGTTPGAPPEPGGGTTVMTKNVVGPSGNVDPVEALKAVLSNTTNIVAALRSESIGTIGNILGSDLLQNMSNQQFIGELQNALLTNPTNPNWNEAFKQTTGFDFSETPAGRAATALVSLQDQNTGVSQIVTAKDTNGNTIYAAVLSDLKNPENSTGAIFDPKTGQIGYKSDYNFNAPVNLTEYTPITPGVTPIPKGPSVTPASGETPATALVQNVATKLGISIQDAQIMQMTNPVLFQNLSQIEVPTTTPTTTPTITPTITPSFVPSTKTTTTVSPKTTVFPTAGPTIDPFSTTQTPIPPTTTAATTTTTTPTPPRIPSTSVTPPVPPRPPTPKVEITDRPIVPPITETVTSLSPTPPGTPPKAPGVPTGPSTEKTKSPEFKPETFVYSNVPKTLRGSPYAQQQLPTTGQTVSLGGGAGGVNVESGQPQQAKWNIASLKLKEEAEGTPDYGALSSALGI